MSDVAVTASTAAPQGVHKNKPEATNRRRFGVDMVILALVMLYLIVPLGATLAFGLTSLSAGGGIDLHTIPEILSDPFFRQSLTLSLELAVASTVLTVVIVTPTAYWVQVYLPQARPLMDFLALVPFAVPAIVMAYGLVQVYGPSSPLVNILSLGLVPLLNALNVGNTPPLLACAYVIVALPFVYRPIDNSLRAINTRALMEASYSLGSGWLRTFVQVILPNILPGVISAALLTFSTVMGEFTLATFFGNMDTFPVYLLSTGAGEPQKGATLAILSFIFTVLCGLGILLLIRLRPGGAKQGADFDLVATK